MVGQENSEMVLIAVVACGRLTRQNPVRQRKIRNRFETYVGLLSLLGVLWLFPDVSNAQTRAPVAGPGNAQGVPADDRGFVKIGTHYKGGSEDAGAQIQIDGKPVGKSPYVAELPIGTHTVLIVPDKYYHQETRSVQVTAAGLALEIELQPSFGQLIVATNPPDAEILIDGRAIDRKTTNPSKFPRLLSGEHTIEVRRQLYKPQQRTVQIEDEQTFSADFQLAADFGNLEVSTSVPNVTVYVDGSRVGETTANSPVLRIPELVAGPHLVRVSKEHYVMEEQTVPVGDGKTTRINFEPRPDHGSIDISSTPQGAEVLLDRQVTDCVTPCNLPYVQPGDHIVGLRLDGHTEASQPVNVVAGATATVTQKLEEGSGLLSVISTSVDGTFCEGSVFIDDALVGPTPWKGNVSATKHQIRVDCDRDTGVADVVVSPNGRETISIATTPMGRLTIKAVYKNKTTCDTGIVRVMGTENAEKEIWGTLPFDAWIPAGPHTVRVDCADGSGDHDISVIPGRHDDVTIMVGGRPVYQAWPWVTVVLGSLAVAGGGVLNYYGNANISEVANAERDELGNITGMTLAEAKKLEDDGNLMNNSSIAMYAVGGAALLTGLIVGIVDAVQVKNARDRSKARSLNPSGFFVPGGAGIGIVGGF